MGHGLLPPLKIRSASAPEARATASRRGIAASGHGHRCFQPVALVLDRGRCPERPCGADCVSGHRWSDFAGYRTYSLKSVKKVTARRVASPTNAPNNPANGERCPPYRTRRPVLVWPAEQDRHHTLDIKPPTPARGNAFRAGKRNVDKPAGGMPRPKRASTTSDRCAVSWAPLRSMRALRFVRASGFLTRPDMPGRVRDRGV